MPLPQPAAQDKTLSELLELINRQLTEKGLKVEKASAAVIDATIIQTAGSKQCQAIEVDEEGQVSGQTTPSKDKDARWTKKNGLYRLGYKQRDDFLHLQRGDVDNEAVFDVAFQHPLVGGVDVGHVDHFHVGGDVVLAAEIQQFLRFFDAADNGTGDRAAAKDHQRGIQRRGDFAHQADVHQRAVEFQRRDVGVDVVRIGNGVDDELKLVRHALHLRGIGGNYHVVRAEAFGVCRFTGAAREEGDFCAEGVSEFYRHMAEAAETDDRDFAAFADVPVAQRRPGSDAGAEDGRHGFGIEVFRHFQHEGVADGDGFGIAAVGGLAVVFVDAAVSCDEAVFAVLLEIVFAGFAVTAAIDEAADVDEVAGLELADLRADAAHAANDFMSRYYGVYRAAPVVTRGVQVAVADAGVEDVDNNVIGARRCGIRR